MSQGSNIELAHRDLGIEIEKLIEEKEMWKELAWLGYRVIHDKWEPTQFEQAYEEAIQ